MTCFCRKWNKRSGRSSHTRYASIQFHEPLNLYALMFYFHNSSPLMMLYNRLASLRKKLYMPDWYVCLSFLSWNALLSLCIFSVWVMKLTRCEVLWCHLQQISIFINKVTYVHWIPMFLLCKLTCTSPVWVMKLARNVNSCDSLYSKLASFCTKLYGQWVCMFKLYKLRYTTTYVMCGSWNGQEL